MKLSISNAYLHCNFGDIIHDFELLLLCVSKFTSHHHFILDGYTVYQLCLLLIISTKVILRGCNLNQGFLTLATFKILPQVLYNLMQDKLQQMGSTGNREGKKDRITMQTPFFLNLGNSCWPSNYTWLLKSKICCIFSVFGFSKL